MATLSDVSQYLRQRRATGKPITQRDRTAAWQAYFDSQNASSLDRSKLALARDSQALQEKSVNANIAANAESRAIQRENMKNAEKAATIQGAVQLGGLGLMAAKTDIGSKALTGAWNLGKNALGVQSSVAAPLAASSSPLTITGTSTVPTGLVSTGGAVTAPTSALSTAPAITGPGGSMTAATTGASWAAPAIGGLAGGVIGGWVGDRTMNSKTIQDVVEKGTFGVVHAKKDAAKLTGAATGAAIGGLVGGPPGAILGAVIGGVWNEAGDAAKEVGNFAHSAWNKTTDVFGTWICTKTKETVGMTEDEWATIGTFRKWVFENHKEWIDFYIDVGPELIEAINGDEVFYGRLKETFLTPVMSLTKGGYMDAAYKTYKSVFIQLANDYKPDVLKDAPGGE